MKEKIKLEFNDDGQLVNRDLRDDDNE